MNTKEKTMTQEDIELLLKDLSARLTYGVKVTWDGKHPLTVTPHEYYAIISEDNKNNLPKIFLRPMSTMTEEEKKEYHKTFRAEAYGNGYVYVESVHSFDWLNKHSFDYRGLIVEGLALEAPEGMYKLAI